MSNLAKRLLSAAVVVPILLYLFWRGGWLFVVLIELAILLGMNEYYRMVETRGLSPKKLVGIAAALLIGLIALTGRVDYMALFLSLVVLVVMIDQLASRDLSAVITGSAVTLFGVIYIGWMLSHALLLRFPTDPPAGVDLGLFFVILAIAGTFLADAGAFFVGRAFGRHKLAPFISPGKTWEGAIGGVVGGTLGIVGTKLVFDWFIFPTPGSGMPLYHCLILGLILVPATIGGDLFESMLKRDAGIKDSGALIPGHGGIMDRLDSILFALPVTYYYLRFAVYGGVL